MDKKSKELLINDLCARLPHGVMVQMTGKDKPVKLKHINIYAMPMMKPYLRPMYSMTDEEKEEFENLLEGIVDGIERWDKPDLCEEYDWLNEHYFDYRGLIPMGIALEALPGMYNIKQE